MPAVDGTAASGASSGSRPSRPLVTQIGIRSWRGNDDVLDAMVRVHRAAPRGAPPLRGRAARAHREHRREGARPGAGGGGDGARASRGRAGDPRRQRSRGGRLLCRSRPHRLHPGGAGGGDPGGGHRSRGHARAHRRRRDAASWCRRGTPTRWPRPFSACSRIPPARRPWPGRDGSGWRRTSRSPPSSTGRRPSTRGSLAARGRA